MNTPYPASTSSLPGLRVGSGIQRLQRVVATTARAVATGLDRGLQPSRLANLRFSPFTQDDQAGAQPRQKPNHDGHIPPPC